MDWAHIDLNAKTWSLPATATKTRSAHVFHLPTLAVEILGSRFTDAGRPAKGLVLPSTKAKAELTTFTSMKRTLKDSVAEAQTTTESSSPQRQPPNWTFHDFRRSFASACAEAGVAESVADAILSHTQSATRGGVLGVYQRSTRVAEQVAAMSVWDRLLGNSINPPDSIENVIQVASWAQAAS
jgi:integrase